MNGQEMLEALGYIDEKYIDDAARIPKRKRNRWIVPLAGAACAGIALLTAWQLATYQSKGVESIQLAMEDFAVEVNDATEAAIASYSMDAAPIARSSGATEAAGATATAAIIPYEMTVQVVQQQEDGTVLCTVVNPGTGAFQPGQQLQIVWNQAENASASPEETAQLQKTFVITYLPTDEDVISPMSICPVED